MAATSNSSSNISLFGAGPTAQCKKKNLGCSCVAIQPRLSTHGYQKDSRLIALVWLLSINAIGASLRLFDARSLSASRLLRLRLRRGASTELCMTAAALCWRKIGPPAELRISLGLSLAQLPVSPALQRAPGAPVPKQSAGVFISALRIREGVCRWRVSPTRSPDMLAICDLAPGQAKLGRCFQESDNLPCAGKPFGAG
jgi:hypothetical protein